MIPLYMGSIHATLHICPVVGVAVAGGQSSLPAFPCVSMGNRVNATMTKQFIVYNFFVFIDRKNTSPNKSFSRFIRVRNLLQNEIILNIKKVTVL